ncbi:hypothetical protein J2T58_001398 [Methanocalculus alkaliphilus]|uniref:hypothetical protein n=1 Tax=Methanocalculus alkaliphilus TaxID=768730 RepID=UPI00209FB0DC|nr:hypothetical protein [Methanocalculus alkaliphilus]MCP1715533.1 hypothetical protein [Methanocalculus alkaliphilus]
MAKEIELGLELTGEDALTFHRYNKKPYDTRDGRELIKEAVRLSKKASETIHL